MSSQSRSTTDPGWIYDVFLSFRGEDTRRTFTSHLYNALTQAAIYVFMDDEELRRGDQISPSLLQAIESSRISLVVLSENYASSSWCLDELAKIIECNRTTGQRVMPIFYGVEPSEVRHQTGLTGKALLQHMKRFSEDKVEVWRAALHQTANTSGFDLRGSRNEAEEINKIVEYITRLLDSTILFVAQHPVGVESRVQRVIELLNYRRSKNVLILGILGIGGIGKTTLAKAIYNQIHRRFEGCCFLPDIREFWEQTAEY